MAETRDSDGFIASEATPLLVQQDEVRRDGSLARKHLWILPALAIGVFLGAADQTIVVSSYGKIGSELNALNKTSWLATAYLLTLSSFQLLYGKLSDIFGRKTLFIFAYTTFGGGCLFCGLARTMDELIIARAVAGMGGGGLNTLATIVLSDIVPLRQRGTWQGYRNLAYAIGLGAGSLGGAITDHIGWRWSFLLQVPLVIAGLLNICIAFEFDSDDNEEPWKQKLKRVDFGGASLIVLAVSTLLAGLDRGSNDSWRSPITVGCLCASLVTSLAFLFVELKIAVEPFAPGHVIFERSMLSCNLCNFLAYGCWLATFYNLPLYWQAAEGRSATQSAVWLLPGIVSGVAGSLIAGLIIQRSGRYYWLTVFSYIGVALGTLVIVLFTGGLLTSLSGVCLGLSLCAFGLNTGSTSTLVALMAQAGPEDQATAISSFHLFRSLGSEVGLALSGTVVQQVLDRELRTTFKGSADIRTILEQVRKSLAYISTLEPETRELVRSCYGTAVRWSFALSCFFATGSFLACLAIREKSLVGRK